ncbi:MAG: sulfatase [bacterium]|nr:sulfatase [bacterium]
MMWPLRRPALRWPRVPFIPGVVLALLLPVAVSNCRGTEESANPDVVLITLDTTRADHLGVYGYERPTSPRLDAFAREAVVYERAWTTAPWTLPSHASMITGKYPTSHGAHYDAKAGNTSISEVLSFVPAANFRANRLGEGEHTLAELLVERGYVTGAFAGGHWLAPEFGLMQGYQTTTAGARSLAGRPASELNTRVFAWLEQLPRDSPFHLLVNYFDAHDPYQLIEGAEPMPELMEPHPDPAIRAQIDAYDGEIRYMDHHLGELFEALKAAGRYQDSLIIVVSDHGELFGEHDQFKHGPWLYEELLRAAMIVRLPAGEAAGTRVRDAVSIVDILPIVAQEVGFVLPEGVEGVPPGRRELVVAEARPHAVALRKFGESMNRSLTSAIRWPFKLVASSRGGRDFFRLDDDPGELRPLGLGAEMESLAADLEALQASMRAPERSERAKAASSETEENLRALGYIE